MYRDGTSTVSPEFVFCFYIFYYETLYRDVTLLINDA